MNAKHIARTILLETVAGTADALASRSDVIDTGPAVLRLQLGGLVFPASEIAHIISSCATSHLRMAHGVTGATASDVATAAANNAAAVLGMMLECDED